MDPYRTSLEGQRVRAEQAKSDALAEHDRLTTFLLQHLDPNLVARMNELRTTLDGDEVDADATLDFWIAYEGYGRALSEAVATAIATASDLRGELATPGDDPPRLPPPEWGGASVTVEQLRRALPRDVDDVSLRRTAEWTEGTFAWSGHPMRVAAHGQDDGLVFRVTTAVAPGGPALRVVPGGLFHRSSTGDEEFDGRYTSRATDAAITTWLTPAVRKALLAIARVDPAHLDIERGSAVVRYSFGIEDPKPLRQCVKLLALLREAEVRVPTLVRGRKR